ncbi:uncharacterized protein N7496_007364 [Penicillium cataractarum]|uniref:Uncharacterized protein n=1 Tax=Penicillium cataractarum TaxID=2100454 RepID=A0A9W9S399_9EURO|nr:uncharacterized protein N7496_007364 [Penicillium cataractarum]KAJ5371272.1 hypothetical protein N7496_007364 [Penicillium cataractarum]
MPLLIDLEATKNLLLEINGYLTALLSETEDRDELGLSQYLQLVNLLYFSTLKLLLDFSEIDSDDAKQARERLMKAATEALGVSQATRRAFTIHENIPGSVRQDLLRGSRLIQSYYNNPQVERLLRAIDSEMAQKSSINSEDENSMAEEGTQDATAGDDEQDTS